VAALVTEATTETPAAAVDKSVETLNREEAEQIQDVDMADAEAPVPTVVTTRAGRTSKTATPLTGSFPEIPLPTGRAGRSTRNKDTGGGSHASSESGYGERPARKKRGNNGGASTPSLLAEATFKKAGKADADEDSILPDDEPSENPEIAAEADDDGDEEMEVDENEPRYCYCNGVSYGEMVACDNEECPREWFHLKCAGLKEPPAEDSKFLFTISLTR
jgi:hypothetical protein